MKCEMTERKSPSPREAFLGKLGVLAYIEAVMKDRERHDGYTRERMHLRCTLPSSLRFM